MGFNWLGLFTGILTLVGLVGSGSSLNLAAQQPHANASLQVSTSIAQMPSALFHRGSGRIERTV